VGFRRVVVPSTVRLRSSRCFLNLGSGSAFQEREPTLSTLTCLPPYGGEDVRYSEQLAVAVRRFLASFCLQYLTDTALVQVVGQKFVRTGYVREEPVLEPLQYKEFTALSKSTPQIRHFVH